MTGIINKTDSDACLELTKALHANSNVTMDRDERVKETFVKEALVKTNFTDQKIKSLLRNKRSGDGDKNKEKPSDQTSERVDPSYMINIFMDSLSQNQLDLLAVFSSEADRDAIAADTDARLAADLAMSDSSSAQEAAERIAAAAASAASTSPSLVFSDDSSGIGSGDLKKSRLIATLLPEDWAVLETLSGVQRDIFASLSPNQRRSFASLSSGEQRNFFMFSPSSRSQNFLLSLPTHEQRNFFISLSPARQELFISLPPVQQRFFTSLLPVQQSFFSSLAPERQSALTSLPSSQWSLLTSLPMDQWLLFVFLQPAQRKLFTSLSRTQRKFFASLSPVLRKLFISLSLEQRKLFTSLSSEQRYRLEGAVTARRQQTALQQPGPSAIQRLEDYVNNMFPIAESDAEDSFEAPHILAISAQLEETRHLQVLPSPNYFANYIARANTDRERDIYIEQILVSNNHLAIDSIINHIRGYLNRETDPESIKARVNILAGSSNAKVIELLHEDTRTEVLEELQALGFIAEQKHAVKKTDQQAASSFGRLIEDQEQPGPSSSNKRPAEEDINPNAEPKRTRQDESSDDDSRGSGNINSADCLPGLSGSGGRGKRAVSEKVCEYDWDDVDRFNEEQVELREFSKIRIDSEKFLTELKDPSMSHAKRMQLVQLAGEVPVTGIAKEHVSGLVKHRKTLEHLNRVGRISGAVMNGMMWKNMLSDAWKGDLKGVAINAGFIGWGRVGGKLTSAVEKVGSQLVAQGSRGMVQSLKAGAAFNEMIESGSRIMVGQSLRLSSPFLARTTSAFIAYDLINQIQACKAGSSEGCIRATGDEAILVIDAIGAGIEVAELFGILEGVSSVTGPIGGTVSVLIFVGMDVYFAVKRVDEEDKLIHLTSTEKFFEGLRAFGGIGSAEYIERLIAEKQGNNKQYKNGIAFLKQYTDIQRYLLPSLKTADEKICKIVIGPSHYEPYGAAGMGDRLMPGKEKEECKYKLEINLDNAVYLDQKYNSTFVMWSRTKPDVIEGNLFCTPRGVDIEIPKEGDYYCDNVMGIEYSDGRTGNATWFELGDGNDRIISFPYGDNIVRLGDGDKLVSLAEGNDTVVLYGDKTTGAVYGGNGSDTLVLSAFAQGASKMYLKLSTKKASYPFEVMKEDSAVPVLYTSLRRMLTQRLEVHGMNNFLLRKNKQDIVEVACDTHYIDAGGGYIAKSEYDAISIPEDERCNYTMVLMARHYTRINNYSKGEGSEFIYRVPDYHDPLYSDKETYINLKGGNSTHQFVFDYPLTHIYRLFKNANQTIFSFVKDVKKHDRYRYHPYEIKVSITQSGSNNLSFILKDNTEIKVLRNHFYAFQNTNSSVEEVKDIIRDYPRIAQRLKLSISVFSKLTNETIMIGNRKQEVLFNDPFSQRTHLIGNGGENIFVVTSGHEVLTESQLPIPEVLLYDRDDQNLIDTLDLRQLSNQVEKDLGLKMQQRTELLNKDIGIELFVLTPAGNRRVLMIRLKDASETNWYKRLHVVINHAPMELDTFKLRPLPLEFGPDINFIIITPEDIEEGTTLAIPKKLGNIHYFRSENNLFITNRLNDDIPEDDRVVLLLKEFYQEPKLETIVIRFTNKELVLRDEMASIRNAVSFLSVYVQHNRTMYDEIFAQNTTQESIIPVLRSHSRRSHHELADGEALSKNAQGLMPLDIPYPLLVAGTTAMFIGGSAFGIGALVVGGLAIKRMIAQHRVRANALPMTVVQAAVVSPLLSAQTVEAKSINKEVALANSDKARIVQMDGCVLGAREGDKWVAGLTCYTKNAQAMVFPKESDVKLEKPEDKFFKESCHPIEFNGRPSIYCEGEESNIVYTPEISEPPFSLDRINDLLLLSQVGLHLGKKLYHWLQGSSSEKASKTSHTAPITTEQKTIWIELIIDIETQLAHLDTDKLGDELRWIQPILEDRKKEYKYLSQKSDASLEEVTALTENLQALQAELDEIQKTIATAKLPGETEVLEKAGSTRMSAISSNPMQPVALVEQQLRHRIGWAMQGNNTLSFFQAAPSFLSTSNDSRMNATSIQQSFIGGR